MYDNGHGLFVPAEYITEAVAVWSPQNAAREDLARTGLAWGSAQHDERSQSGFYNEDELREARATCRWLAMSNPYARNGHENRISYTVGWGMPPKAIAKEDAPEGLAEQVQEVLDEFAERNKWYQRQQETVLRKDRDGEAFLRFFEKDGRVTVRFVEPGQVSTPSGKTEARDRMGVRTHPDDVELVEGYWIDGELVPAADIQHRKANVDFNVRRGAPLFWPVVDTLEQIKDIRRNMSAGSKAQTSVAYTRTIKGGTKDGTTRLANLNADYTSVDPRSGAVRLSEIQRPGRIVYKPENVDYDFPFANTRYDQYVAVIADDLREVASLLGQPEFMLTSDASNANYSSTMVAEGPAIKRFERLQAVQQDEDKAVYWKVIDVAERAGKLPEGCRDFIDIQAEPPSMAVRNELAESETLAVELQNGVVSPQTWAQRRGYDYEQEQENRAAHVEAGGTLPSQQPPGMGLGGLLTDPAAKPVDEPTLPAGAPTDTTAAATGNVQAAALNGQQIASLVSITELVTAGTHTTAAAKVLIRVSFPLIGQADIDALVDALEVKPVAPVASATEGVSMVMSKPKPNITESRYPPDLLRAAAEYLEEQNYP